MKKMPAEHLADEVKALTPKDSLDAYQKALAILSEQQGEASVEEILSGAQGRTPLDLQALAKNAAHILYPPTS